MADVDIDPFGEHGRTEEPMGKDISLPLVIQRSTSLGTTREQETSFRGESQRTKLTKDYVKDLYKKLSENIGETPEALHFDYFKLEDGELYYRGRSKPLTYEGGKLKSFKEIKKILGKNRLHNLGFFEDKVTAEQAVMLNRVEEEIPSVSDIAKADDIELQEIMENASKSMEDLITQFERQETLPMCELLGLDKQLRSIRGSLKVEVAKKVQLEECIKKEHHKLKEFREYPGVYDDAMREDITN